MIAALQCPQYALCLHAPHRGLFHEHYPDGLQPDDAHSADARQRSHLHRHHRESLSEWAAGSVGRLAGSRDEPGAGALQVYDPTRKNPYAQRWSVGFQRQLPGQFVVETSYVGNRGTKLAVDRDLNAFPNQYLSTSAVRDQERINLLGQNFANPFSGLNSIYGTNTNRGQFLRPYPQFGSITVNQPVGYSWYHAMQTRVERRFSQGLTAQFSHTWAKAMEAVSFLKTRSSAPRLITRPTSRTWAIRIRTRRTRPTGQSRVRTARAAGSLRCGFRSRTGSRGAGTGGGPPLILGTPARFGWRQVL